MAAETTVGKVEGREVGESGCLSFLKAAYFFHVEACRGGSGKKCR